MTVDDALTPSLRGLIAEALDEPLEAVHRGVRCVAGGLVTGMIGRVGTPSGATDLLTAIRSMDVGLLFDASPLLDSDWREPRSPGLLGEREGAVARAAGAQTAISAASAMALLHLVEPLVLAAIARTGVATDESGLRSYLRSVEPEAARLAPPTGAAEDKPDATSAAPLPLAATPARTRRAHWRWVLLGMILIALVLLFTVGRG